MQSLWILSLPFLLCLGSASAALVLTTKVARVGPIAAIFPPWWQPERVFQAAGTAGRIIRLGQWRFVVVVNSEGSQTPERLRAAGAVLLTDPGLAIGCSAISRPVGTVDR